MAHYAGRTTLPALVLPLFFLLSSPVRPCISLLECSVTGAVAAEDGALELLLLEATKTVVTLVVTLVNCFPWSSFCASSGSEESGAYGGGGLLYCFLRSGKERADGGSTPLLVLRFLPVLGSSVGFASSLFLSYPAHSLCLSLLYTLFPLFFFVSAVSFPVSCVRFSSAPLWFSRSKSPVSSASFLLFFFLVYLHPPCRAWLFPPFSPSVLSLSLLCFSPLSLPSFSSFFPGPACMDYLWLL